MGKHLANAALVAVVSVGPACIGHAQGQVVIETVTVGNPGNLGELSGASVFIAGNYNGTGPDRICGAVPYTYEIGTYEVTSGQYTAFLNAVAATDTYGLYLASMNLTQGYPIKIVRSGDPGTYTYSVAPDWANRPVGFIAFPDALRFVNWLHNGQPTGAQDLTTTEDGSYLLNGATTNQELQNVERKATATWVVPSEDEWYKAAYHFNDGVTGNYWDFPTQFNTDFFGATPINDVIDPDPGNCANFWLPIDDDSIGAPYWRTEVGEFENSGSAYGTFDQGGNQWEWTDTHVNEPGQGTQTHRVIRGGSFYNFTESAYQMHSSWREDAATVAGLGRYGFRVGRVANDCNGNGVLDQADLAGGTSTDFNYNLLPDDCDIASGASLDCNGNGIPDEAEVGGVSPPAYRWDDGVRETSLGYQSGSNMAWLNRFAVDPLRSTIAAVAISYGPVPNGTPVKIYLWSDPTGDGNPADAIVLAVASTTVANADTDILNVVDIPDTLMQPAGAIFFVGALIQQAPLTFPANIDLTSVQSKSWFFANLNGAVNANNLGAAPIQGLIDDFEYPGNWTIRALPVALIGDNDLDDDGVPDDCAAPCPWDLDANGAIGVTDFLALLQAWGGNPGGPPDFDGSGDVGVTDLLALLSNWGSCP